MENEQLPPIDYTITNDKKWLRRLLPVLVVLIGAAMAVVIVKSRKKPPRKKPVDRGVLVETLVARKQPRRVIVRGHGSVTPERELTIAPEVAGKLLYVNPAFVVGGVLKKGAVLMRIDPTDYRLAYSRARAQIAQAKRTLAEAQSNAQVARREWKVLGKQLGRKATPLTLGVPQLEQAQAALASAQADLKQAQVRVARTVLRAPFDLRVRRESVEVGQFVSPPAQLATVFGTARAEVQVPLKVDELRWIDVPKQRFNAKGQAEKVGLGSPAWVSLRVGSKVYRRRARLDRTVGEIDPTGRLTKVVVSLEDPYNLSAKHHGQGYQPDFEIGAFVEVAIEGRQLDDVVPIPAEALHIGSRVWVVGKDNKLTIRKVVVQRLDEKEALVSAGLQVGDKIVVTPLANAVEGLKLRLRDDTPKAPPKTPMAPKAPNAAKQPPTKASAG